MSASGQKDFWDKLQIILAPVGGLLTAVAVAMLGFIGSRALEQQQNSEAKLRLYCELMSKRERSEATLRKEMFQSIIGSFFDARTSSLESKLLKMELLAGNFHEALSLTPLFEHSRREIVAAPLDPPARRSYENRLTELARQVVLGRDGVMVRFKLNESIGVADSKSYLGAIIGMKGQGLKPLLGKEF